MACSSRNKCFCRSCSYLLHWYSRLIPAGCYPRGHVPNWRWRSWEAMPGNILFTPFLPSWFCTGNMYTCASYLNTPHKYWYKVLLLIIIWTFVDNCRLPRRDMKIWARACQSPPDLYSDISKHYRFVFASITIDGLTQLHKFDYPRVGCHPLSL